ncbi:MAG: hypothetical protein HY822_21795 [Acidobacteria bacterium]|nr:hypothetical protein [Acidobacteriota bacterium]
MREIVLVLLAAAALSAQSGAIRPEFPRAEFRVDPEGIDVAAPRLSWRVVAAPGVRGARQSADRILVASE